MTSSRALSMLDAAQGYARRGWPVFPVYGVVDGRCGCGKSACKHPGKHPMTQHGVKDATLDEYTIRQWWEKTPDANIGIATGLVSGLYVIDIDPRNGGDDAFLELCRAIGTLPETYEVLTGGGGRHLYFKYPNKPPAIRAKLARGVDVRADGGYVVAAPSLHGSGRRYEVEISTEHLEPADLPAAWTTRITEERQSPSAAANVPIGEYVEGERNTTLTSLAGRLRRVGLDEAEILPALLSANERRCHPPLVRREIETIARSVCRYPAGQMDRPLPVLEGFDLAVFLQQEHVYPESLIGKGLLIPGGLALLAGRPGIGKTWLSLDLAVAAMTGGCWLGDEQLPVRQCRVAFIAMELPDYALHQRLTRILAVRGLDGIPLAQGWVLPEPPASAVSLSTPQGQDNLRRFVGQHNLELLILDPFSRFHASDENAAKEVGEVLGAIDSIRHETGCAIVLVHHVRKSGDPGKDQGGLDSVRGSSRLISDPQTVLLFRKRKPGFCLTSEKVNLGPELVPRWFSILEEGGFRPAEPPADRQAAKVDSLDWLREALRAAGSIGLSAEEIEKLPEAPQVKHTTLLAYLRDLRSAGQATSTGGRKNCRWQWQEDKSDPES